MDQRQRSVLSGVGLEQRIADEVVTAKGQHCATRREDFLGMGLDTVRYRLRRAVIEVAIAVVDHGQMVEGVEGPRPMPFPGDPGRGTANPPWPEARARAVAGG